MWRNIGSWTNMHWTNDAPTRISLALLPFKGWQWCALGTSFFNESMMRVPMLTSTTRKHARTHACMRIHTKESSMLRQKKTPKHEDEGSARNLMQIRMLSDILVRREKKLPRRIE